MRTRGVKIVCKANGVRRRNDVDVFDLETGEKLTDIYEVDLGITREAQTVRITSHADWVYEGPATFMTPEETDGEKQTMAAEIDHLQVLVAYLERVIATITDDEVWKQIVKDREAGNQQP